MHQGRQRGARKVVAMAVVGCVVCVALGPGFLLAGKAGGPGPEEPPWLFPAMSAQWTGEGVWASERHLRGPAAVVYVDRSCRHCQAELELWAGMLSNGDTEIDVWVVASPRSVMDDSAWVPPSLRGRTVKDDDGSIARVLGVNAVPVTFWLDRGNTVRAIGVGRSTRRKLVEYAAAAGKDVGGS